MSRRRCDRRGSLLRRMQTSRRGHDQERDGILCVRTLSNESTCDLEAIIRVELVEPDEFEVPTVFFMRGRAGECLVHLAQAPDDQLRRHCTQPLPCQLRLGNAVGKSSFCCMNQHSDIAQAAIRGRLHSQLKEGRLRSHPRTELPTQILPIPPAGKGSKRRVVQRMLRMSECPPRHRRQRPGCTTTRN